MTNNILTLLQMTGYAVSILERAYPHRSAMELIDDADDEQIAALTEEERPFPDRDAQIRSLVNAAAENLRAAELLSRKLAREDLIAMNLGMQIDAVPTPKPQPIPVADCTRN